MGGTSAAPIGRPLPSVRGRALGEVVALFMSTYVNKVDRKGRVSVPATFRAQLMGSSFQGIAAYPLSGEEVLEAAGIDRLEAIARASDARDQSDEHRSLYRLVLRRAQLLPFDPEGRILLPERFIAHAHITESAAFVGQGPTFQIWEPDRLAADEAAWEERVLRQGIRMGPLDGSAGEDGR
jgi:MraZ protein